MPLLYAVASRRCKATSLSRPWKNGIPVADQNGHDRIAHVVGQSEAQAFSGYFTTAYKQDTAQVGPQSLRHLVTRDFPFSNVRPQRCERRDSNSHALASASPSTRRLR